MAFLTSTAGILVMIFGFGVLIFVHELGHFLAAKWAGIRTEGFAVGMGPVMTSWRKGVGLCLGSTESKVVARAGKPAAELTGDELTQHGLGETEYSLRWLPIGGFVKMLGQEDLNPNAVSADPRSYNVCPVGKRMVVVSAGVVMNIILALVFFMWAFLVGVQFDAPVIGTVFAASPAETAVATNAQALGVTKPGLKPADRVLSIDGKPCRTYSDIAIAAAMSRRGVGLDLRVERPGVPEPLEFVVVPKLDPLAGVLSVGVGPGATTQLVGESGGEGLAKLLEQAGLSQQNVRPGMRMVDAAGAPVATYEQFEAHVAEHGGPTIATRWQLEDDDGKPTGSSVVADVRVRPEFQVLRYPVLAEDGKRDYERGLFGLVPLTRVAAVLPESENASLLRVDDAFLRVGSRVAPRLRDLIKELAAHRNRPIAVTVLRNGKEESFEAQVSREGRLGFAPGYAWDLPILAESMEEIATPTGDAAKTVPAPTPLAGSELAAGTTIRSVGSRTARNWDDVRAALRAETSEALASKTEATIAMSVLAPGASAPATLNVTLSPGQVKELHALSWHSDLPSAMFEPLYTTLSADGNPLLALKMGFTETHKMITMTYLTIDRLIRGTVGVEQLRGPVGIIDLGTKVLPRGFMFFLFFLGMISVNLAVLNFLPLPIVDGGLFLFLVYEKIRGIPPSVRFQNAAAIVGLCLIGAVFVVTFYNDIMRLVST